VGERLGPSDHEPQSNDPNLLTSGQGNGNMLVRRSEEVLHAGDSSPPYLQPEAETQHQAEGPFDDELSRWIREVEDATLMETLRNADFWRYLGEYTAVSGPIHPDDWPDVIGRFHLAYPQWNGS
jgi:hypothetical protein